MMHIQEVPQHVSDLIDNDLREAYLSSVAEKGNNDLVLVSDSEDIDAVYVAPRDVFMADMPREGATTSMILNTITCSAAEITGTRFAFWFVVLVGDVEAHCIAIGCKSKGMLN